MNEPFLCHFLITGVQRNMYVCLWHINHFILDVTHSNDEHRLWDNCRYGESPFHYDSVGHCLYYDLHFGKTNIQQTCGYLPSL